MMETNVPNRLVRISMVDRAGLPDPTVQQPVGEVESMDILVPENTCPGLAQYLAHAS